MIELDRNTIISRLLILSAIWIPVLVGPTQVFGISVFGVALFISLFYVFLWSLSGSKWEAIKQEYHNLVRHREDGGLTSVTAAMFLLGAQMYLVTQVVWIISVINKFVIDPNWYQFCERAGYILMGGRPLQMGVRYISTKVSDLYQKGRRRNDDSIDSSDDIYDPGDFPGNEDLLKLTQPRPNSHYGKSGTPQTVTPKTKAEKFVFKFWEPAKRWEKKTGLSAIFTLAQGGLERGWSIASPGYNLFGITASSNYRGKKVLLRTKEQHDTPNVKYPVIHSIRKDEKKKKYIYDCERYFRVYNSYEECFADRLKVLQKPHFSHAWPHRGDPFEFVRQLQAGRKKYATGSGYVDAMNGFIKQVERIIKKLGLK
ncbi:MAG: glucosaminidase domain-containing protein [Desulfocapsaceae bacterium]|nr:glucosaminidase domain-containing protein [Desulfocapsaceae bacterium]